jgi:hypothetical protein
VTVVAHNDQVCSPSCSDSISCCIHGLSRQPCVLAVP